jgi:hypothetical protein
MALYTVYSTKKERDADLQQQKLGANADSSVDFEIQIIQFAVYRN